jgi:hypothetical protein
MTKWIVCTLLILGACSTHMFAAAPSVVYISFNGSDTAACSRTAPCRTVTHALSVVAAGGVVDIVGSGLYDSFTVTKSVTVTTDPGVVATIVVPASATGILVNAAATDVVALKGLTLIGAGSGTGISIQSVSRATVEDCDSRNFFHALEYVPSVGGTVKVVGGSYSGDADTSIFLCCNSTPSPGVNITVDGAHVYGGAFAGINADGAQIVITHTVLTGPTTACSVGPADVGIYAIHGAVVAENDTISGFCFGIWVDTPTYVSADTITGNGEGVIVGPMFTRGNNTIENNVTNVDGTLTPFSPI